MFHGDSSTPGPSATGCGPSVTRRTERRSGWWPLPGPTEYDHDRGQFWLLTVLDRDGLTPTVSAPVLSSTVSVARTDDGTLWVAAGGVLQILRPGTMQWPDPVDLGLQ